MSQEYNYLDIASAMFARATDSGLISGALGVIPELSDLEKKFFIVLMAEIHKDELQEFSQDEVVHLFNFVTAKACETVSCWNSEQDIDFGFEDMLESEVALCGDGDIIEEVRRSEISRIMAETFFDYLDGCQLPPDIDPMLPLMEALKWNWRITISMALDILGK